jgi:hypothetical protein
MIEVEIGVAEIAGMGELRPVRHLHVAIVPDEQALGRVPSACG